MATGIAALASSLELDAPALARGLTTMNIAIFAVLCALFIARFIRYPRRVVLDLRDFERGPAFFAIVAATTVLGEQMLEIFDWPYAHTSFPTS